MLIFFRFLFHNNTIISLCSNDPLAIYYDSTDRGSLLKCRERIGELKSSFSAVVGRSSPRRIVKAKEKENESVDRIRNGRSLEESRRESCDDRIINGARLRKVGGARFASGAKNDFRSLGRAANEPRYPVSRRARIRLPGEHGGWPVRCVSPLSCSLSRSSPDPCKYLRSWYRSLAGERFSLDSVQKTIDVSITDCETDCENFLIFQKNTFFVRKVEFYSVIDNWPSEINVFF